MKTKEIRDLIDFISETGLNEVHIETEELKLSVKRNPDVSTATVVGGTIAHSNAESGQLNLAQNDKATESVDVALSTDEESGNSEIKSPMIGTFYLSPNPESEPYVAVGDSIEKGQTVCIIEAMKLFNEIEADVSGIIVKILVDDTTPVEYDQPLFLIGPS